MNLPDIRFAQTGPPELHAVARYSLAFKHPFFAWIGLRPPIAQHSASEHLALEKYAAGRKSLVEIGVAEGASAIALRVAMDPQGVLFLVDPFHLSRVRFLNFLRRAARKAVSAGPSRKIVWIESFSQGAARDWNRPIDFLLIDGDHREEAVERDWKDWSPHVSQDGIVAFHDARLFPGGWTSPDYGPVCFVDRFFRNNPSSPWAIIEEVDSLVFVRRRGTPSQ